MIYRTAADILAEADRRGMRRAFVVTAMMLEMEAVQSHIEHLGSVSGEDGAVYECGVFSDLGQDWLVVVTETGEGTHAALSAVSYGRDRDRSRSRYGRATRAGIVRGCSGGRRSTRHRHYDLGISTGRTCVRCPAECPARPQDFKRRRCVVQHRECGHHPRQIEFGDARACTPNSRTDRTRSRPAHSPCA